jgi:hypothetical protein
MKIQGLERSEVGTLFGGYSASRNERSKNENIKSGDDISYAIDTRPKYNEL